MEAIAKLSNSLYPDGRAFAMPDGEGNGDVYVDKNGNTYITAEGDPYVPGSYSETGGILKRLHRALGVSEAQLWDDARSLYDSIIPDTDRFTADDATVWERRLKIVTGNTDLTTRKQAIIRKMNYPGSTAPRQSAVYLQEQLQAAGFNVFIYENIFPDGMGGYMTKTPDDILGPVSGAANLGAFDLGASNLGELFKGTLIVNYIEEVMDAKFAIGSNLRSTFYIAGGTISTFADVPADRKAEFRQLILQLKPAQTVGFMFVNYV